MRKTATTWCFSQWDKLHDATTHKTWAYSISPAHFQGPLAGLLAAMLSPAWVSWWSWCDSWIGAQQKATYLHPSSINNQIIHNQHIETLRECRSQRDSNTRRRSNSNDAASTGFFGALSPNGSAAVQKVVASTERSSRSSLHRPAAKRSFNSCQEDPRRCKTANSMWQNVAKLRISTNLPSSEAVLLQKSANPSLMLFDRDVQWFQFPPTKLPFKSRMPFTHPPIQIRLSRPFQL